MKRARFPLFAAAAAFLAFAPSLRNGFVSWDDHMTLVYNLAYRDLGWENLRWMFSTFLLGHYQPLSWLSFWLDHRLWGVAPAGYHLTNLLLHAANTAQVYGLALLLLEKRPGLRWGALFAALLFGLHPLRAESVVWATERRDVLSACFLLAATRCYLQAQRLPRRRPSFMNMAAVLYLLSLLSKVVGITWPGALLLLDAYPLGRFSRNPRKLLALLAEKWAFIVLSLAAAFVGMTAQGSGTALVPYSQYGAGARFGQAAYQLGFYLWKTLWPVGLSPLYEKSFTLEPSAFWGFGGAAAAVTTALLLLRRRWPAGLAAWALYGLMLIPALGIVKSGRQIAADRFTYLPCLGLALLAGAGVQRLWESGPAAARRTLLAGSCVLFMGLGILSWRQTAFWHDSVSLWSRVVDVDPRSYFGRQNLAAALTAEGRHAEAAEEQAHAKRARADVFEQAGRKLLGRGEDARAEEYLKKARGPA